MHFLSKIISFFRFNLTICDILILFLLISHCNNLTQFCFNIKDFRLFIGELIFDLWPFSIFKILMSSKKNLLFCFFKLIKIIPFFKKLFLFLIFFLIFRDYRTQCFIEMENEDIINFHLIQFSFFLLIGLMTNSSITWYVLLFLALIFYSNKL